MKTAEKSAKPSKRALKTAKPLKIDPFFSTRPTTLFHPKLASNRLKTALKRILTISFALISTPALALNDAQLDKFNRNGIYYYNPSAVLACFTQSDDVPVSGSTAAEMIWSGLTSFMTEEQAAGVMGNMVHESNLNPAQHEMSKLRKYQPGFDLTTLSVDGSRVSYGIGLIQWSFGRRVNFINYIKENHSDLLTYLEDYQTYSPTYHDGDWFIEAAGESAAAALISAELSYLKQELTNHSSYAGIFSQTSVYDSAKYFLEHVEIPNNPTIEAHPERATDAQKYYDEFHGKTISGSATCSAEGDIATLQEYVKKYAWPDYHPAPYTAMMPDYAEVIAKRRSEGLYVGAGGIDCGGFVTTIIQESGYDPNYNYSGKGGATPTQLRWLRANWTLLNANENTPIDTSILQPGDVAIYSNSEHGHTFLYVGEIDGFNSDVASASFKERSPMAGRPSLTYGPDKMIVLWFRKS